MSIAYNIPRFCKCIRFIKKGEYNKRNSRKVTEKAKKQVNLIFSTLFAPKLEFAMSKTKPRYQLIIADTLQKSIRYINKKGSLNSFNDEF